MRISYVDAILGTEIKVATVDGDVDLKVAAGTQPETVTRLAEKGAPKLGGKGRGACFVSCPDAWRSESAPCHVYRQPLWCTCVHARTHAR